MNLVPEQIYDIVRYIDDDKDGLISFHGFKKAFSDSSMDEIDNIGELVKQDKENENANQVVDDLFIPPKIIPELHEEKKDQLAGVSASEIDPSIINNFKTKIKSANAASFTSIWNSRNSGTRSKLSVWIPSLENAFLQRNKVKLCIGHYPNDSFDNPARLSGGNARMIMEITDTSCNYLTKSALMDVVTSTICPCPVRYRQVWSFFYGSNEGLYVWKPVPPTEDFVSLGMVISTSDDPPPLDAVHCVPKRWVIKSTTKPKMVWSNKGTGGKPGSIWVVNSLNTLYAVQGHTLDSNEFFPDVTSNRFFFSPEDVAAGKRLEAQLRGNSSVSSGK